WARRTSTRTSSRAASSSSWPWPGPWWRAPRSSSRTSPRGTYTRARPRRSWSCSRSSTARARPSSRSRTRSRTPAMDTGSSRCRTAGSSPSDAVAGDAPPRETMKEHPGPRILIADDQPDVLEALRLLLKGEGFAIETAASPAAIMAAIEARDFDVVLMDLNYARDTTSGQEGLDLLTRIQALDHTLPIVVMTAWASIELAVEAMRRGARDFIQKPWENARLLAIVRTQIELGQALRRGDRLEAELGLLRDEGRVKLIAEAQSMQPVLQLVARVGPSDANVL